MENKGNVISFSDNASRVPVGFVIISSGKGGRLHTRLLKSPYAENLEEIANELVRLAESLRRKN